MTGASSDRPESSGWIALYLGEDAASGGPFALLGLPHEIDDAGMVRAAMARRLAEIDRHPWRHTAEADEARLAVHAAAAQLGDRSLREELKRVWPPGRSTGYPAFVARSARFANVTERLTRQARLLVGASGGWNARAKKRLAHLARANRVTADDLVRSLRPLAARAGRSVPVNGRASIPDIRIDAPRSSGRLWLMIHSVLVVMLIVMVSLTGVAALRPDPASTPGLVADASDTNRQTMGSNATAPGARSNIGHHAALAQELQQIARLPAGEAEQKSQRTVRTLATFLSRWTDIPSEQRAMIVDSIRGLLAAQEHTRLQTARTLLDDVAMGRDPVQASAGQAVVELLSQDDGLSTETRAWCEAFAERHPQTSETGYDAIVHARLVRHAQSARSDDRSYWQSWSIAHAACTGVPEPKRTRSRLDALQDLLSGPGEPTPDDRAVLATVASELSWRRGQPARAWFLERFEDAAVQGRRLSMLTTVLANDLSVPGVDPTMVLGSQPTPDARSEMAARYRSAWTEPTTGASPVLATILSELQRTLEGFETSDQISEMVRLARVNAAASLLFQEQPELAAEVLASDLGELADPAAAMPVRPRSFIQIGPEWASGLLGVSEPAMIEEELLLALRSAGRYDPLAAELVVSFALQGPSRGVRDAARGIIATRPPDPQILLALDRAATRRASAAISEIVTDLTGVSLGQPREAGWLLGVRAALLLLTVESVQNPGADTLSLAELRLAEFAARRAGHDSHAPLVRGLLTECDRWARSNTLLSDHHLSNESIEARTAARSRNAVGHAQQVAVQHLTLVETLAALVRTHDMRSEDWTDRFLSRLGDDWSEAGVVLDQLVRAHRAEAELWRAILEARP